MANLIITKPLLALRGILIFPGMIANIDVGRENLWLLLTQLN